MTKTVVIVMQEQNWEDDGGSHNPFVVTISDEDYEELRKVELLEQSGAHEELYERMNAGMIDPTYPLQIDDVLNIWYEF